MKSLIAILAAGLAVVVVACAAGSRPQTAAPSSADHGQTAPMSPQASQIDTLAQQIEHDRQAMGLPEPTAGASAAGVAVAMAAPPTVASDKTCHPASTDTCKQSCTLADSICTNAGKICDLASQMAGDDWAAKKCGNARETCEAAHKKCCDCQQ